MSQAQFRTALAFMLLGMFCISLNDLTIKKLSGGYPLHQMVFVRSAIGLVFSLAFVYFEGGWRILKTRRIGLHLVRTLSIFASNMTFFAALSILPLGQTTALFFVAPIVITVLSIPMLGERVGPRRIVAVIVGFLGVIVMMKPHTWDQGEISPVIYMLPVLAAVFYAITQILTRKLSIASKPSALAVYIQTTFLVLSAGFGLVAGRGDYMHLSDNPAMVFLLRPWIWPAPQDVPFFLLLGLVTAGIGYSLSRAYSSANAASIAPYEYVLLPLAIFWGWFVFGDLPDIYVAIGILMIVGSGLYVFLRERHRNEPNAFERTLDEP